MSARWLSPGRGPGRASSDRTRAVRGPAPGPSPRPGRVTGGPSRRARSGTRRRSRAAGATASSGTEDLAQARRYWRTTCDRDPASAVRGDQDRRAPPRGAGRATSTSARGPVRAPERVAPRRGAASATVREGDSFVQVRQPLAVRGEALVAQALERGRRAYSRDGPVLADCRRVARGEPCRNRATSVSSSIDPRRGGGRACPGRTSSHQCPASTPAAGRGPTGRATAPGAGTTPMGRRSRARGRRRSRRGGGDVGGGPATRPGPGRGGPRVERADRRRRSRAVPAVGLPASIVSSCPWSSASPNAGLTPGPSPAGRTSGRRSAEVPRASTTPRVAPRHAPRMSSVTAPRAATDGRMIVAWPTPR